MIGRAVAAVAFLAASTLSSAHAADGKTFASPTQAADALASAWRSGNTAQLLAIFGPDAKKLVSSGDPIAEHDARARLAAAYAEAHRLEAAGAREVVIVLGKDEWPYPIPLVGQDTAWHFDVKAGAEQIIDRRIGRNELNAISVCRAYVDAQRDYAMKDRLGDGLHEYAQKVASSEGKHDGLYWQIAAGGEESPLGPLVALAEGQGYGAPRASGPHAPFHGYFYKILTRQGANAPGGARDYIAEGHMTRGFALIAYPAIYGDSGVMTFIINQNGIVFEKNLGPDSSDIARHIADYNPDETWNIAQP